MIFDIRLNMQFYDDYYPNCCLLFYFNVLMWNQGKYGKCGSDDLLNNLAKPKSHNLTWPPLVIKIFSGFTSLCIHCKRK